MQASNPGVDQAICTLCFDGQCSNMSIRPYWMIMLSNSSIPLLTSYLLILSITRRVMLKSPAVITHLFISLVSAGSFSLCIWQLFHLVHTH